MKPIYPFEKYLLDNEALKTENCSVISIHASFNHCFTMLHVYVYDERGWTGDSLLLSPSPYLLSLYSRLPSPTTKINLPMKYDENRALPYKFM